MSQPKLFQPIQLGRLALQHRVVLAPLTRIKSERTDHVPDVPLMKEYYTQRASTPGTLLITEATLIAARAGGFPNVPGIWNQPQIDAWKQITDGVHAKGSFIFLQIVALGRAADPSTLSVENPTYPFVSASPIKLTGRPASELTPRALSIAEIDEHVALFAQAARNAIQAGFDGIEIHGANGYLVDQFIQDVSNVREDEYGGSVENRSRFALRVVDAIVDAIGVDRTAIRLSPWSTFQGASSTLPFPHRSMLTSLDKQTWACVTPSSTARCGRLVSRAPSTRVKQGVACRMGPAPHGQRWGYDLTTAIEFAEEHDDLVAFGRNFISNPDLPKRLQRDIPLTPYDRKTFYVPAEDPNAAHGYIDYPFAEEGGGRIVT
ncbi:NADH:flavin oxidoreductase/NADH oxidase [Infundibulicybe gibba]|nr:NADH:flavin oxidoreductase/NADH oxidase [Infundibulicybe gibba]